MLLLEYLFTVFLMTLYLLDIFKYHVAVPIECFDTSKQLVVVAAAD